MQNRRTGRVGESETICRRSPERVLGLPMRPVPVENSPFAAVLIISHVLKPCRFHFYVAHPRDFLMSALAPSATLMTVRGPLPASSLGLILPHEHLFSMFGEEPSALTRNDPPLLI